MLRLPKPLRLNFHCVEDLPAGTLSASLRLVAVFFQTVDGDTNLRCHQDWREHGVDFYPFMFEKRITFHDLFETVGSPRGLLSAASDDEGVFIGFAPDDDSWYLRYRLEWNEDGTHLIGRFDVTLTREMAQEFKTTTLRDLPVVLEEQDAEAYFASIGPLP